MVQTFVNFLKEAKMVRVVIMGGPGSGKSTYSEYIIRHFGIKHIYPGGLLRKEIDKGGPDGQKIKNLLDQGKFAPNDIVLKLIRKEVASATKGYVLDGYPRYMQQVRDMEKFGIGYDVVVFLDVDKEEVIKRLAAASGIDVLNLVRSMQEIQGKEQQAQQMAMQQQQQEQQVAMMKTPMMDPSKNPALAAQMKPPEQV